MAEKKDIAYRIYQAKTKVSVFDLLYEFGIAYTALKPILDEFVENKILATEDGKYYEFIGDGRMFSGKRKKEQLKHFDNEQEKELQERRAYLEARRRELIKKCKLIWRWTMKRMRRSTMTMMKHLWTRPLYLNYAWLKKL